MKLKKLLNYICVVSGLILALLAMLKHDDILSIISFLFSYAVLNNMLLDKSRETIVKLQKQLDDINTKLGDK